MKLRSIFLYFLIGLTISEVSNAQSSFQDTTGSEIQRREEPTAKVLLGMIPSRDRANALVIFAKFEDGNPGDTLAPNWAEDIFNPNLPGSLSHFYSTMSGGAFTFTGSHLKKKYLSNHPASCYTDRDFKQFTQEILEKADGDVDFGEYDNDGPDGIPNSGDDDGYVDALFINVEGMPYNFIQGPATGVCWWGTLDRFVTDDPGGPLGKIKIRLKAMQNHSCFTNAVWGMAHEFGHALGLLDLYNPSYLSNPDQPPEENSAGIGKWGVMAHGTTGWHRNDGPNPFCAYSLQQLGWIGKDNQNLVVVTETMTDVVIEPLYSGGKVYKILITRGEYFLISNRQSSACWYDRHIPENGLLIWHVVRGIVDLECADGLFDDKGFPDGKSSNPESGKDNLDFWSSDPVYRENHNGNMGDATDVFDGEKFTSFGPRTNPNSKSDVLDLATGVEVTNIHRKGTSMIVDFIMPNFVSLYDFHISDYGYGNGNSIANPGERIYLQFSLRNQTPNKKLTVIFSTNDDFVNPDQGFSPINMNLSVQPFAVTGFIGGPIFLISPDCPDGHIITFTLTISDGISTWLDSLSIPVKGSPIPPVIHYVNPLQDRYRVVGEPIDVECELFSAAKPKSVAAIALSVPDSVEIARVKLTEDPNWSTIPGLRFYAGSFTPPLGFVFSIIVRATDIYGNTSIKSSDLYSSKPFAVESDVLVISLNVGERNEETAALLTLGIPYDYWIIHETGELTSDLLNQYAQKERVVIWSYLLPALMWIYSPYKSIVKSFLDSGGNLFIYDPAGFRLDEDIKQFLSKYLYVNYTGKCLKASLLEGVPGDPITDGIDISVSGRYEKLSVSPPAVPIFTASDNNAAALRVDTGTYKLIYFAFDFNNIENAEARNKLMANIANWLGPVRTAVVEHSDLKHLQSFCLSQNYPNSFSSTTTIKYQLKQPQQIRFAIYNLLGQRVAELVNEFQQPGSYSLVWDGKDEEGKNLASGVYLCQLESTKFSTVRKITLLK